MEKLQEHRLRMYLSKIGGVKDAEHLLDKVPDEFSYTDNALFVGTAHSIKSVMYLFARMLVRAGQPRYGVFNIYDFVTMMWGEHPQYKTYTHISLPMVIVWGDGTEMHNKNLETATVDFLQRRSVRGEPVWLYLSKGIYPTIDEYCSDWEQIIDLGGIKKYDKSKPL